MFEDKITAENLMSSLVDDLLDASRSSSRDGNCDYSADTIEKLERIKQVIPVWGIESVSVEPDKIDRKSNKFGGHPFTSEKHPWPLNGDDSPYYPLIQIDLKGISQLCNKSFGHGLLQVWLDISDPGLPSVLRIIDSVDMTESVLNDAPSGERTQELDELNSWFGISTAVAFKFSGYMLPHWGDEDAEWDYSRDLSEKEVEILNKFEELSEAHGYQSLSSSWLMGYPDRGSGSPVGRYIPEPLNLIQFSTSDVFPMADVSCYANIFYSEIDGDVMYFFDWNG